MGYVFLAFSETSRDFALHTRNVLESARISIWLREPLLDNELDRELIYTALQSASVMLVVWRKSSENTSYVVQLQRELSQARQLNIPIVMLTNEDEFEPVIRKLKAMVPSQSGGAPLPIPMVDVDIARINSLVADLQRPSRRTPITLLMAGAGVIIFVGLLMVFRSPGTSLNPFTATPSDTATASQTATSTPSATSTFTATPTSTATSTFTATPTSSATASFTPTLTPTSSATASFTPTLTPTSSATASLMPTLDSSLTSTPTLVPTSSSGIIVTVSPFLTNTQSSTDQ